jgi:Uma2 family endonuclease
MTEILITPAEYLAAERNGFERNEYFDGELHTMAGASFIHNFIANRIVLSLGQTLQAKPQYTVLFSDLRVHNPLDNSYLYPDVVIVDMENLLFADEHQDILLNPLVIFEILSPSTEALDRGKKLDSYTSLPSLQEYFLVSQEQPCIERYKRSNAHEWLYTRLVGIDTTAHIETVQCTLALADVYATIQQKR